MENFDFRNKSNFIKKALSKSFSQMIVYIFT